MSKILIIEDDISLQHYISTLLKNNGYDVCVASNLSSASSMFYSHSPDVILLDLTLGEEDGEVFLKKNRELTQSSIIIVSAIDDFSKKVHLLDEGADDYITKPFNPGELLARIRVGLRKKTSNDPTKQSFQYQKLLIDYEKECVFIEDKEIHLTPLEYQILKYLTLNHGRVCTTNAILKAIWGVHYTQADAQNLRVFMANLRKKIEPNPTRPNYLLTHVGVGYRFID
ncbi:MAG: response regulator transcription factor [Erysipelothrix sp.]|nr:response regulator transcription factor [Erysipelothrix sp.]